MFDLAIVRSEKLSHVCVIKNPGTWETAILYRKKTRGDGGYIAIEAILFRSRFSFFFRSLLNFNRRRRVSFVLPSVSSLSIFFLVFFG